MKIDEMKNETNTEKCLACQHAEFRQETGVWESQEARNHWMLYGCTCDPEAEKEAEAFLRLNAG